MRSPKQLAKAWEVATKEKPLLLSDDEFENFIKAMRLFGAIEDARISGGKINTTIMDKDKLLANGIISPLDMKTAFHNRRDYADHLKRNGCVEIGNDFNKSTEKKREIKGDFDVRAELSEATHRVMEKYGH